MKKKFMVIFLVAVLVVNASACGCQKEQDRAAIDTVETTEVKVNENDNTTEASQNVESTEVTETTEATEATEVTEETFPDKTIENTEPPLIIEMPEKPGEKPTVAPEPAEDETDPTEQQEETLPADDDKVTLDDYNQMSAQEQKDFYNSFPSQDAFFDWYNAAAAEKDSENIIIDGSTNIEIAP